MSDKKSALLLAGASALFAAVALFLGLPAIVYEANPGEFKAPFLNVIATYAPWAAALVALMLVPAILLPGRYGRIWAALMAVLASYVWAHGVFQTHNFGAMDGHNWSADVPRWQIYLEALVIAAGGLLIYLIALRAQKVVVIFSLLLAAGLLAQVWPVANKSSWIEVSETVEMPRVASFSPDKNALVVLMDTMASDIFEEVVKGNPTIAEALDGFIFYPDTAGASPTTYLAMPTIHSGQVYKAGPSVSAFFRDMVKDHSALTKVSDAGYHATLVNPMQKVCPRRVNCLSDEAAIKSERYEVRTEGVRILDAVLFRIAPLGLKDAVYNDDAWVIHNLTVDPNFVQRSITHNYFLRELGRSISAKSDVPTLKFIHLMTTHAPFVYNSDCTYAGTALRRVRENVTVQTRCSLESFAALLSALKAHNLYDQTAIILMADHGNQAIESSRTGLPGSIAKIVGAANPTFAIKPIGSKGPFKTAGGEIHLGDFGATLCDLLDACTVEHGVSALKAPTGRVRLFNHYVWKHQFWGASEIKGLTPYEIRGPLPTTTNWIKDVKPIKVGQVVDFSDTGQGSQFKWNGWSDPEEWGTWSQEELATLLFAPDKSGPMKLVVKVIGYGNVQVAAKINNRSIGEMNFDGTTTPREFSFDVPQQALGEDFLRVDFAIADPKSPLELGRSDDDRRLGIGLMSLTFEPTAP